MSKKDNLILELINETEILGKPIRMYGSVEAPLFLASDVADWIDYAKNPNGSRQTSKMVKNIDKDEKLVVKLLPPGDIQARECTVLTEDGLYEVCMRSTKPIAKQMKKEIKLYLKQIRLTGGYIPVSEEDDEKVILAKAMKILQRTLEEKEELIKMQQPKVDAYNRLCKSESSHEMKDACKVLDYGRNKLFAKLRADGYLMSDNTPYQKYVKQGLFKERITPTTHGRTYHVTLMTDKGITYFDRLFNSGKAVNP